MDMNFRNDGRLPEREAMLACSDGPARPDPEPMLQEREIRAQEEFVRTVGENKIRQIVIEQLNRGYVVRVGCHAFAIGTPGELITKLIEYINDPAKTEAKWRAGDLF